ncbi:MAG: 3-oxoacyl-ACP reductase FabG [Clostridia bacterium]|nr:3-oxoacyl-ACP reductase FabG [Clostridia bacterium]
MNKTVFITGASRGIGKEIALLFAKNNFNVAINYLNNEKGAETLYRQLQEQDCNALKVQGDVGNRNSVERMVTKTYDQFGEINVLINNAGIAQQKLFTDISNDDWDNMFNVNIKGVFNCCQCVLPKMIKNRQGKIINISSIWGMTGGSCEVHYSASKAAVIGFTKALAKEVGLSNIQVNCVAPGVIDTDMNSDLDDSAINEIKERTPLGVIGAPRDIAEAVLFLASEKSNFITGQVISPNGGFLI